MIYGYSRRRIDESRQDMVRQRQELYALGVSDDKHIFWEFEDGTRESRAELTKLLDKVVAGDTIVATDILRLTHTTKHLCEILQLVKDKKLILNIGGTFIVDCSKGEIDPETEGMIKMWDVFAKMERNIVSQHVKSGMLDAAANGKRIGRPEITVDNIPREFWKYYPIYKDKKLSVTDFARIMRRSRVTIYKYIAIAENAPTEKITAACARRQGF